MKLGNDDRCFDLLILQSKVPHHSSCPRNPLHGQMLQVSTLELWTLEPEPGPLESVDLWNTFEIYLIRQA